jgi:hypothetical protein
VRAALSRLEERLCNRIASDILMPDAALIDWLAEEGFPSTPLRLGHVEGSLSILSRKCLVSREALLVKCSRLVAAGVIQWPKETTLFLIELSDRDETGRRSYKAARVKVTVSGRALERAAAYPFIPLRKLEPELEPLVDAILTGRTSSRGRRDVVFGGARLEAGPRFDSKGTVEWSLKRQASMGGGERATIWMTVES